MSARHRIRRLEREPLRYVCSARGCTFSGTYAEAMAHLAPKVAK